MNGARSLSIAALALYFALPAAADTFGSGDDSFEIAFVLVGQPGNAADSAGDPNPGGRVDYAYRIGKYEISSGQIAGANAAGNLGITVSSPSDYSPNLPAAGVSWFEAAAFVNWLNTSKGHLPAYKFYDDGIFQLWQPGDPGYDPANLFRNSLAFYFLPSADEWYKAAYYDPITGVYYQYPTGSNTGPQMGSGTAANTAVYAGPEFGPNVEVTQAGGLSPYGTMAQGGSVWEWEETEFDLMNDSQLAFRGLRGGAWNTGIGALLSAYRFGNHPGSEGIATGFRVASKIPEPTTLALAVLAGGGLLAFRRRTRLARDRN